MKKMHIFFSIVFFTGIIELLYFYPLLPDRMAVHFNASGNADGWGTKDHFFLTIETLFSLLVVLFLALPLVLYRTPNSLINLPHKDYWLTPDRREHTIGRLVNQLLFVGAMTLLLMDGILYMCFQANFSVKSMIHPEWLWTMIACFIAINIICTISLIRSFRRPFLNPPAF